MDKVVELVGGGSVIKGAYPGKFLVYYLIFYGKIQTALTY